MIWIIYNVRKGMKSRIKEAIVSQINKYIDIKVEPDNNSNFFFFFGVTYAIIYQSEIVKFIH